MDIFYEQLVKKQLTPMDMMKRGGLLTAFVIVAFLAFFVLPAFSALFASFSIFIVAAAAYGVWYLWGMTNLEYEYILTNGEIDVDKIISQRKRKRMVTVNVRNFTEMGKYADHAEELSRQNFASKVEAARDPRGEDCWYAVTDHAKYGHMLLLFSPNDHIMDGCRDYLKRGVLKD